MVVFLAWADAGFSSGVVGVTPGPWHEVRRAADDLLLVHSDESLSRVYHELKWTLSDDSALLVAPVGATPKLRGLPPRTLSWLRARTDPPLRPEGTR